jgi:cell division protein ZipA
MDLTIRDWMVIIGVLLIMAVLLDAWRRVRSERYSRVKVKLAATEETGSERDVDLAWPKELPNGGGRVVERGDLIKAASRHQAKNEASAPVQVESGSAVQSSGAAVSASNLDDDDSESASNEAESAPSDDVERVAGMSSAEPVGDPENMDWLDGMGAADASPSAQPEDDVDADAGRLPRDVDPEVFMLNVVSRSPDGFRGEDILHILLACDLRFGDMNFFHRHEFEAGRGAIQFSIANMMQPGVFDIDNMADMATPGLVFFLTLPGPEDMMKAFDYMLETAQAVARNLGGDVLDESRSVLTRQTMDHCRQQIRDLERRMLAKAR